MATVFLTAFFAVMPCLRAFLRAVGFTVCAFADLFFLCGKTFFPQRFPFCRAFFLQGFSLRRAFFLQGAFCRRFFRFGFGFGGFFLCLFFFFLQGKLHAGFRRRVFFLRFFLKRFRGFAAAQRRCVLFHGGFFRRFCVGTGARPRFLRCFDFFFNTFDLFRARRHVHADFRFLFFFHAFPSLNREHVLTDNGNRLSIENPRACRHSGIIIIERAARRVPAVNRVARGFHRRFVRG